MFDRKKAAEYFVVAWVKDWNVQTYLATIGASDKTLEEIHDAYPWMPTKTHFYLSKKKIKQIAASYMRQINDSLFDAKDNAQRLKIAAKIERFISDKHKETSYDKEKRKEYHKAHRKMEAEIFMQSVEIEKRRRASGNHWNVCK